MLGYLPALRRLHQIIQRNRLVNLRANRRFAKPRITCKLGARRGLQQAKTVHEKLERLILRLDLMLLIQVITGHIAARMAGFRGTQNAPVGERYFAVRAAADTQIIPETPVIQVVLALITWFRVGRGFVLRITGCGQQLMPLLENIPQRVVVRQHRRARAKQRIRLYGQLIPGEMWRAQRNRLA